MDRMHTADSVAALALMQCADMWCYRGILQGVRNDARKELNEFSKGKSF